MHLSVVSAWTFANSPNTLDGKGRSQMEVTDIYQYSTVS